jgi:hypothetical protein
MIKEHRSYSISLPGFLDVILKIVAIVALGKYIGWWAQ